MLPALQAITEKSSLKSEVRSLKLKDERIKNKNNGFRFKPCIAGLNRDDGF
jgi:hypothetical protein